jgi:hypothetical protein
VAVCGLILLLWATTFFWEFGLVDHNYHLSGVMESGHSR